MATMTEIEGFDRVLTRDEILGVVEEERAKVSWDLPPLRTRKEEDAELLDLARAYLAEGDEEIALEVWLSVHDETWDVEAAAEKLEALEALRATLPASAVAVAA